MKIKNLGAMVKNYNLLKICVGLSILSLLTAISLYFVDPSLSTRSLLLLVPILLCSIFCFIYKDNILKIESFTLQPVVILGPYKIKLLYMFNLLLGLISIFLLLNSPERSLLFIFAVALMGTILLFQIIFTEKTNVSLFFIQLIFIHLILTYGLTLKYPFYFGSGDIVPHIKWAELITSSHQMTGEFGYSTYKFFPLYHLLLAVSSDLIGMPTQKGIFIVCGLLMPIADICAYGISYKITKDVKFSSLMTLFFVFNREVIFYSSYMITRTLAFIMLCFIIYLLLFNNSPIKKMLLLFFTVALTLMHQTTLIHFTFILIVLYLSFKIFAKENIMNYVLFFCVTYITYWFFVATSFTNRVIIKLVEENEYLQSTLMTFAQDSAEFVPSPSALFIVNRIDFGILFFLLTLLFVIFISQHRTLKKAEYIILPSFVFALLYFPNPLLLFAQSMDMLLLYRLPLMVSIFVAFLAALGYTLFIKSMNNTKQKVVTLTIVFLIFSSFSIINDKNSADVSLVQDVNFLTNYHFTEQELDSFYFLKNHNDSTVYTNTPSVYTDVDSNLITKYYLLMNSDILNPDFFTNESGSGFDGSYVLLNVDNLFDKYVELKEGHSGFGGSVTKFRYDVDRTAFDEINPNLKQKSLIYTNKKMEIYY